MLAAARFDTRVSIEWEMNFGVLSASQALLRGISVKAAKRGAWMGMTGFDPESPTNGRLDTGSRALKNQASNSDVTA